jgi:hypothetical protein
VKAAVTNIYICSSPLLTLTYTSNFFFPYFVGAMVPTGPHVAPPCKEYKSLIYILQMTKVFNKGLNAFISTSGLTILFFLA